MRRAFPPDVVAGLRRLWAGRRPLLDALARCPLAVGRGDAQRRNLLARRDPGGRERTVGIDWPHLAASHVGTDAATLVHQALIYFDADIEGAARLDRAVCDAYTEGLAAGGWGLEPRVVRLAFTLRLVFAHGGPSGSGSCGPSSMRVSTPGSKRCTGGGPWGRSSTAGRPSRATCCTSPTRPPT